MRSEEIGYLLGQQCAPILAGIKPSNLLIVEPGNQKELSCILRGTGRGRCCKKYFWKSRTGTETGFDGHAAQLEKLCCMTFMRTGPRGR